MSDLDVILIGAGHNGLTCAAYLGMAGLRVRVLERRSVGGGACVTEEFHPGFRNSTAAYSVENEADLVGERRAAAGAVA
jgi:phytoene dehydrogenase-like protein